MYATKSLRKLGAKRHAAVADELRRLRAGADKWALLDAVARAMRLYGFSRHEVEVAFGDGDHEAVFRDLKALDYPVLQSGFRTSGATPAQRGAHGKYTPPSRAASHAPKDLPAGWRPTRVVADDDDDEAPTIVARHISGAGPSTSANMPLADALTISGAGRPGTRGRERHQGRRR